MSSDPSAPLTTDPTASAVVGDGGAAVVDDGSATDACDPDLEECFVVVADGGDDGQSAGPVAAVVPTSIDQQSGWNGSIAVLVLIILLTLGIVLGPALAWRFFSTRGPT